MNVLGIESSCDETAASVVGATGVLSDVVHSQVIHAEYGGVVPELASRAHVEKMGTVVRAALSEAGIERPDAVAATAGPGLIGAVLVGLSFAKGLAAAWDVPFLGINHLEGHLLSALLEDPAPAFPFLGLVVSGGHSTVYLARDVGNYTVLGETIDDAAGEAFDKTARMMRLGYPGGPVVDRLAAEGNPKAVKFPRPRPGDLDFSFSGLKTAVRTHVQKKDRASDVDVCASFQAAVVDCLLGRVKEAAERTGVRRLALAGGVAANSELRRRALELDLDVFVPPKNRCTDNGAMIANAGRQRLIRGERHAMDLGARPGWRVDE
ncbi:MAG: tRNA (adenosine(37)-N6)-threonylcarbamoyltransferase complex transferase subunit TsaD [Proteobacteria bacterium]|nr:tRNA (adenosine(37)-N6)-threonylcarbamoyltransferase complex transferase subunit TsaD [Pseudomonadota bacterium]